MPLVAPHIFFEQRHHASLFGGSQVLWGSTRCKCHGRPRFPPARRLRRRAGGNLGALGGSRSNFKTHSPMRQAQGGLEKDAWYSEPYSGRGVGGEGRADRFLSPICRIFLAVIPLIPSPSPPEYRGRRELVRPGRSACSASGVPTDRPGEKGASQARALLWAR